MSPRDDLSMGSASDSSSLTPWAVLMASIKDSAWGRRGGVGEENGC